MQTLNQLLSEFSKTGDPDFYKGHVPAFIYSNLKERFNVRPYQQEALGRFVFYWNEYANKAEEVPVQLLYHMATGSGKTLIMAGLIIYLYSKGYRNFLFFVNSSAIIDKTKNNFLNPSSSKYLFAESIFVGEKQLRINEVDNFQTAMEDDINIAFSTIQGLHSRLNTPKENSITYDDFDNKKIVLISDEAHHINAETKKGNEPYNEEVISWEGTVNRILNTGKDNVLLEFTATADLSIPEIEKKYSDKLIYDYPLRQFRRDGYSKEVKVLQADLPSFERCLQAVVLSQYRRKLFDKYKNPVKPVLLFKSKTIKESQAFFTEFTSGIKTLQASSLEKIKKTIREEVIEKAFYYFEANNITLENLLTELKEDFSANKLISVNSKEESEQKQLAVNSLEDEDNEYRAIFAVDKLNEGWDVLNLFDIVRLYDAKDNRAGKPGQTTMSEAQLIGRGARYYPFQITPEQHYDGRKFDDDLNNELRICEELYYHSAYNPRYIQELNTAMEEIGIKAKDPEKRTCKPKAQPDTSLGQRDLLPFLKTMQDKPFIVDLKTGRASSGELFNSLNSETTRRKEQEYRFAEFGGTIIRKAMSKLPFYYYSNLKTLFPQLNSVSEFISSADYLGLIRLKVAGLPEPVTALSPSEKLEASLKILQEISTTLPADKPIPELISIRQSHYVYLLTD